MISLESKLVGTRRQFAALDEAIRTTQVIRNSAPQETVVCKSAS
jgi:hypothetical protein